MDTKAEAQRKPLQPTAHSLEQAKVLEQAVNVRDVWETIPDWMPTPIRLREALEAFAKAVKVMEESCN